MSETQLNLGQIQFAEIPYVWKVPGNYMEVKPAINDGAVLPFPAQGLVMGVMGGSATAVSGQPYQITSGAQSDALFAPQSPVAKMCRAWLKNNPYTPLDAVGINPASGNTQATGSITMAGTATAAGTLACYFAGVRVPVQVSLGDTAAMVAQNIHVAFSAQNNTAGFEVIPSMTSSYTSETSVCNLMSTPIGTLGNELDVRINYLPSDVTPPGLTVTITPLTGGAGDPTTTVSSALAGLSKWYTDVAFGWTDTTNLATVAAWAAGRYMAMSKLDVQIYVGLDETYGTALTFATNSQFITPMPLQNSLTPPWIVAAAFGAACCYSTAQQPALQMKTVPLLGVLAPAQADQFTLPEQEALLEAGLSTYYADAQKNVYIQRAVTNYRTNPVSGAPDSRYFDLQDTKVPTRVRYDWDNYIAELYPRNLLSNDGTLGAQFAENVVTPRRLQASWTSRCAVYEKNGWIQNSAVTAKRSRFSIDPNDGNRVNARQQIDVMGNLIVLAGSLEFVSNN